MGSYLAVLAAAVSAFVAMEFWAAALHRWVWHRRLWALHRSHHRRRRGLVPNDLLSALHAPVAIALMLRGVYGPPGITGAVALGWGIGMTVFGLGYVVVHDGFTHRRFAVPLAARSAWLVRVREAHRVHHQSGGVPFGLFLGPQAFAFARRRNARRPAAAAATASWSTTRSGYATTPPAFQGSCTPAPAIPASSGTQRRT